MKKTSRDNTNKANINNNIFNAVGIPLSYAANLVDDLIFILIFNLLKKKQLKIKNFGTLKKKKKKKRIGRNPKNKIEYEILSRNVLTFKAAFELSRKVNIDVKK